MNVNTHANKPTYPKRLKERKVEGSSCVLCKTEAAHSERDDSPQIYEKIAVKSEHLSLVANTEEAMIGSVGCLCRLSGLIPLQISR